MTTMKPTDRPGTTPDRNLALELARVTEAAALAASKWMGRGDKNAADGAAVDAMRLMIDTVSVDGIVVIGEGEKDEAPMLYNGEKVGTGEQARRRYRRRPDRRDDLAVARRRERAVGHLDGRARGRCSIPARACTWRRSRPGPRRPT